MQKIKKKFFQILLSFRVSAWVLYSSFTFSTYSISFLFCVKVFIQLRAFPLLLLYFPSTFPLICISFFSFLFLPPSRSFPLFLDPFFCNHTVIILLQLCAEYWKARKTKSIGVIHRVNMINSTAKLHVDKSIVDTKNQVLHRASIFM